MAIDVAVARRRFVEVHRIPQADGYREVVRVAEPTATVALQAFPDVVLTLAEIFA